MPVHSVLILNDRGRVLFTKYHVHSPSLNGEQRLAFEKSLYLQTRTSWKAAMANIQFAIMPEGEHVVYKAFNDLVLLIAGTDECDELLLVDIIGVVEQLIMSACDNKNKGATEAALLHGDPYGKFCVLLDEMMPQGIIEHMDVGELEKLAKLKPMS